MKVGKKVHFACARMIGGDPGNGPCHGGCISRMPTEDLQGRCHCSKRDPGVDAPSGEDYLGARCMKNPGRRLAGWERGEYCKQGSFGDSQSGTAMDKAPVCQNF